MSTAFKGVDAAIPYQSETGPDPTALRLGKAETTQPGLQQCALHPIGSHEPLGRMSVAQEDVAYFMRYHVPEQHAH